MPAKFVSDLVIFLGDNGSTLKTAWLAEFKKVQHGRQHG